MTANDTELHEQTPASDSVASASPSPPSGAPVVLPRQHTAAFTLPDWAPWVVLGGLVTFGVLGGTGLVPLSLPGVVPSKAAAASPGAIVPTQVANTPALSAKAVAREEEKASVLPLVVT